LAKKTIPSLADDPVAALIAAAHAVQPLALVFPKAVDCPLTVVEKLRYWAPTFVFAFDVTHDRSVYPEPIVQVVVAPASAAAQKIVSSAFVVVTAAGVYRGGPRGGQGSARPVGPRLAVGRHLRYRQGDERGRVGELDPVAAGRRGPADEDAAPAARAGHVVGLGLEQRPDVADPLVSVISPSAGDRRVVGGGHRHQHVPGGDRRPERDGDVRPRGTPRVRLRPDENRTGHRLTSRDGDVHPVETDPPVAVIVARYFVFVGSLSTPIVAMVGRAPPCPICGLVRVPRMSEPQFTPPSSDFWISTLRVRPAAPVTQSVVVWAASWTRTSVAPAGLVTVGVTNGTPSWKVRVLMGRTDIGGLENRRRGRERLRGGVDRPRAVVGLGPDVPADDLVGQADLGQPLGRAVGQDLPVVGPGELDPAGVEVHALPTHRTRVGLFEITGVAGVLEVAAREAPKGGLFAGGDGHGKSLKIQSVLAGRREYNSKPDPTYMREYRNGGRPGERG
jgi:hypothetical protein